MSEGWAAWELPASEHLRTVGEILSAPETPAERRARKTELAEEEAKRASAADTADNVAALQFMGRVNGTAPRDVLAEAAAEPAGRDREAAARRRAAIDALRPLGLEDVITGQPGTVSIFDANMGLLEPTRDEAKRAELDRQYEFQRSEREAEERRRAVERYRQNLDERYRARGLDGTARRDDAARRQYERACAEIGAEPVSYR